VYRCNPLCKALPFVATLQQCLLRMRLLCLSAALCSQSCICWIAVWVSKPRASYGLCSARMTNCLACVQSLPSGIQKNAPQLSIVSDNALWPQQRSNLVFSPMQQHYAQDPVSDYIQAAVTTAVAVHEQDLPGDILIFLTGQEECETAVSMLEEEARRYRRAQGSSLRLMPVALYAGLPAASQLQVFEATPRGYRKVWCQLECCAGLCCAMRCCAVSWYAVL